MSPKLIKKKYWLSAILLLILVMLFFGGTLSVIATNTPVPAPDELGPYSIGFYHTSYYISPYGNYTAKIRYPAEYDGYRAPKTSSEMDFPGIVVCSGYLSPDCTTDWIAEQLTSHGYVTIAFTTPHPMSIDITQWAYGFRGGICKLKAENKRCLSPMKGLLNPEKFGIIGLSMGGAGVLEAAGILKEVDVAVALAPGYCNIKLSGFVWKDTEKASKKITIPIQIQNGSNDGIVPPESGEGYYNLIPGTTTKEIIEINGANHIGYLDQYFAEIAQIADKPCTIGLAEQRRVGGKYFTAWFNRFLKGETVYDKYLFGAEAQKDVDNDILIKWKYNLP